MDERYKVAAILRRLESDVVNGRVEVDEVVEQIIRRMSEYPQNFEITYVLG